MEEFIFVPDKLREAAEEYQSKIVENNPYAEAYDYFNAFIAGAKWMCNNPTGGALLYVLKKGYERGRNDLQCQQPMTEVTGL